MTMPPEVDEFGCVEPVTLYEAYCCVIVDEDPDKDLDEGQCEWSWTCGRYESNADCEVQLSFHLFTEHGIIRPLPYGYEYMQETLTKSLEAWKALNGFA